jgi:hypothetical protein
VSQPLQSVPSGTWHAPCTIPLAQGCHTGFPPAA